MIVPMIVMVQVPFFRQTGAISRIESFTMCFTFDIRTAAILSVMFLGFANSPCVTAQDECVTYMYVPQTVYEQRPVTLSQMVNETVFETQQVTSYKPVWTTEKRERRTTVLKPVVKTSEREERYRVYRPVIETKYREQQIEETSYETTTEVREEKYLVKKPVIEVEYREQKVLVRKPVTQTMMQTENVTTYRPVTVTETAFVPGTELESQLVLDPSSRNRLRWLPRGCYVDPSTGAVVYRKPGLHWVNDPQLQLQTTLRPVLQPQQIERTTYVPETVQVQNPVQVTNYVDELETRNYPVQVQRTSEEIQVFKVPYKVHRPVTKVRTERIPYEEVTYRTEEVVRRVPVTETTYERVEQVEPYEVQVCRWVAETKEVRVPKVVSRLQNYEISQTVPRTVLMKLPVDAAGNILDVPAGVLSSLPSDSMPTYVLPLSQAIVQEPTPRATRKISPVPTPSAADKAPVLEYYGKPISVKENGSSVLVKENQTSAEKPRTELTQVSRPPMPDEKDSNESAGEAKTDQGPDEGKAFTKPEIESDSSDIQSRPGSSEGNGEEKSPDLSAPSDSN